MNPDKPVTCVACGLLVPSEERTTLLDVVAQVQATGGLKPDDGEEDEMWTSTHAAPHFAPCGLPCEAGGGVGYTTKHPTGAAAPTITEWLKALFKGPMEVHREHHCPRCRARRLGDTVH